ncbi:MAG: hypothetical protein A2Z75_02255 [Chloroflexi bacterium RBG_13_50_10]|nr:MAG: hypothetical protein A2Z75_02255 [Chloroflexi bacterium RBG_13_50_10]
MTDNKTWMPMVAGILDIIAGSFGLICSLLFISIGCVIRFVPNIPPYLFPIFTALALPFAIAGILAIVGGIYALQRKIWGLALAGSIAAFIPSWILGIAAIVFTALSKNEFE